MRRIALLVNPESGSGEAEGRVGEVLRSTGAEVEELAVDQHEAALALTPDRVVIAGGDGSLAVGAAVAARAGVPLAVVPTGTANDFARRLDLPHDRDDAARLAGAGRDTRRVELAWIDDRPFLNVASIGLAPVAASRARRLKRALGSLAYAAGAIRAGLTADPVRCRIRCDGERSFAGEAWQVSVAASGAFGGGAGIDADPGDGLLDVIAIPAGSRAGLIFRAYGLRRGGIESQPGIEAWRASRVEVEVPERTLFNVDGELVEKGPGPVGFKAEAQAVEVVVG